MNQLHYCKFLEMEDAGDAVDFAKLTVNLKTSHMKPIHARWLVCVIGIRSKLLRSGFIKAGISD